MNLFTLFTPVDGAAVGNPSVADGDVHRHLQPRSRESTMAHRDKARLRLGGHHVQGEQT